MGFGHWTELNWRDPSGGFRASAIRRNILDRSGNRRVCNRIGAWLVDDRRIGSGLCYGDGLSICVSGRGNDRVAGQSGIRWR